MAASTILLVDDDEVLSQVLRRVLSRQGHAVVEAGNIEQAVRLAGERRPRLGLLDLCLPDGDGVELARRLRQQQGPFPLILMTAYPLRLRDYPELARGFTHVLTKPLNLDELRQAIDAALAGTAPAPAEQVAGPADGTSPVEEPPVSTHPEPAPRAEPPPDLGEAPAPGRRFKAAVVGVALLAAIVGLVLALPALGVPAVRDLLGGFKKQDEATTGAGEEEAPGVRLVKDQPGAFELSPEAGKRLGVKTDVIPREAPPRRLELSGTLAFDPNRLGRVQSRFAGEVVEIGQSKEPETDPDTQQTRPPRPWQFGDKVSGPAYKDGQQVYPGDLLAVVWSKDLGEKKSELVDALVQLDLDQENLRYLEALLKEGNAPEASVRQARRAVAGDLNAASRAERTLRTWRLSDREIQEVKDEAQNIKARKGQHDERKERDWAKVDVRAPFDGVLVERNVNLYNIVDPTFDLFKVADMKDLAVFAHAYEEDLRSLQELQAQIKRDRPWARVPWAVRLGADPGGRPLQSDGVERIGYVVDPSQHTDLVIGRVKNPGGRLRAGQFVTATVEFPAPPGVVGIPASALDEDGADSVVFVQPDPGQPRYVMRRVVVTQRFGDWVYVRSRLTEQEKRRGLTELHPGDRLVTAGVVEIKAGLAEAQGKARAAQK